MSDYEKFLAVKGDLTAKLADIIHAELVKMGPAIKGLSWFSASAREYAKQA